MIVSSLLPGAAEGQRHGRDLPLRDDDPPRLDALPGYEAVGHEDRRPQQEEMQQRLAEDLLHHSLVPVYFAGVYQIGEV